MEFPHLKLIERRNDLLVWELISPGDCDVILARKPDEYDFWNIHDTSDRIIEGRNIGPFNSVDSVINYINENTDDDLTFEIDDGDDEDSAPDPRDTTSDDPNPA